jgi:fumarate reductase subunit D
MFEHKSEPVVARPVFLKRMLGCFGLALGVITLALGAGVAGYRWMAKLTWIDALLNASMILGGMGPVDRMDDSPAKLFAAAYAIFSGLVFISVMGIVLAPAVHRVLHKFHVDERDISPEP